MTTRDLESHVGGEFWDLRRFLGNPEEMERLQLAVEVLPHVDSLLDVGCGNGCFLGLLERSRPAMKLEGVEPSRVAADAAGCSSTIVYASIEALPYDSRTFDVVSVLEVLEHLTLPEYASGLAEIERVASDYVLVSVPYMERRFRINCPVCSCRFDPNHHVRVYGRRTLESLFAGFRLAALRPVLTREPVMRRPLGAIRRAVLGPAAFPLGAVCPQCGYVAGEQTASQQAVRSSTRKLGHLVRRLVPTRLRTKWMIALYSRS